MEDSRGWRARSRSGASEAKEGEDRHRTGERKGKGMREFVLSHTDSKRGQTGVG